MSVGLIRQIARDTIAIARTYARGELNSRAVIGALSQDTTAILAMSRVRRAAGDWHIPLVGGALRRLQTALFGIEIAQNVTLGEGVTFVHTVGIVIGGDTRIGDRTMLLGSNTLGTIKNDGFPTIGRDVVIGAGARILGPVTIGDGASIGANAVVVSDVPPGATAVGIPAVVRGSHSASAPRRAD